MESNLQLKKQEGFTLIELLVGLAISVLVVLVAISYLISSSRLLTVQNNSDLIQENARFAFELISSEMRLAGLNSGTTLDERNSENFLLVEGVTTKSICNNDLNISPNAVGTTACNTSLNYTINGQNVNTDRIAFDYVANQGKTCTGVDITSQLSVVSVYWVADIDGDGIASLYCQAYTSPFVLATKNYTNYSVAGNLPASALVDGIETLQVQFGVDLDDDANSDIERYSLFADVLAGNNIDDVRSVKIGLLISSGEVIPSERNTEDSGANPRVYTVLDQGFGFLATDRIERKTLSTTVFFPNLPPARF